MISEEAMEDQIAASPERFLGESQLTLVSRQLRIGSYIFDLLFEDRHGGKLIVEIQRGTLDRGHTYKILDYYDEYRERNPSEFIDVMVVANQITAERKKRLHAIGISFRELPEQLFSAETEQDGSSHLMKQEMASQKVETKANEISSIAILKAARKSIEEVCNIERWELGGKKGCITAEHRAITAKIEANDCAGMKAQIWITLPEPEDGSWRCTFEIVNRKDKEDLRLRFAKSIRKRLQTRGHPECVGVSKGSTVVRCLISVPTN